MNGQSPSPWPACRRSSRYIAILFGWTLFSTFAVAVLNMNPAHPVSRALLLMGSGLVLIWVLLGGILMFKVRDRMREIVLRLPGHWALKFVVFCILLALAEEAVTVTMTNMAPIFGVPLGKAYITASANYLDVVCFHSVVVFVPWFIAWAWMLSRWNFHPNAVFLIFGITGTLAEMSFGGPQHLLEYGMWTFVYGLMVYLPAYSVPTERPTKRVPWWMHVAGIFIPFPFMILMAPYGVLAKHFHGDIKIHFPPIQPNT